MYTPESGCSYALGGAYVWDSVIGSEFWSDTEFGGRGDEHIYNVHLACDILSVVALEDSACWLMGARACSRAFVKSICFACCNPILGALCENWNCQQSRGYRHSFGLSCIFPKKKTKRCSRCETMGCGADCDCKYDHDTSQKIEGSFKKDPLFCMIGSCQSDKAFRWRSKCKVVSAL